MIKSVHTNNHINYLSNEIQTYLKQEGFNIISNTFKHIDGSKADYIYKLVNIGKAKILTENLNIVVIITDKGINVIIGGLETPPSKFFKFTNKLDKEYFENTYNEMVNYLNEVRI